MKGKLIKTEVNYLLEDDKGVVIASTSLKNVGNRLSKENCDEIFGIVDIEKLAKQKFPNVDNDDYEYDSEWQMLSDEYKKRGFIQGVKEILELNKDKLFTVEDMKEAYGRGFLQQGIKSFNSLIQSLQQPTEMDVEIVMRNSRTGNIVKHDSDLEWDEDGLCDRAIPKLDSEGCLMLKKI